jgi:opacity protein-like surface antigen
MKKLLLISVAAPSLSIAGAASAADMPVKAPNAPAPVPAFAWTSCYDGAHVGGGWAQMDVTNPVELVQDSISAASVTTGVATARLNPSGAVIGGQVGCDYQFVPNWVVGIEGAASGATLKGSTRIALPLGFPGDSALVTARTDFIPSVTARLGYAVDHWLFYLRGGAAWAGDKYSIAGSFTGTAFDFEGLDFRSGWTAGGGVEWAFSGNWSARLEYDYYQFGHSNVLMSDSLNMLSGIVDVKQRVQAVKVGLNFHIWGGQ